MRSSIRFEKSANIEAARLQQLNATGVIDSKDAKNIASTNSANRLASEVSELEFELDKSDKVLGALENSKKAINQMRVLVDQARSLNLQRAETSDLSQSEAITEQRAEIFDQIAELAETASFRGYNFFKEWGAENITIGGESFSIATSDFVDITGGFAYRGGTNNVLGIESGDFDTSAYADMIALYGPNTLTNTYSDFTSNLPDGELLGPGFSTTGGPIFTTAGPNGASAIEFDTPGASLAAGDHVRLPDLDLPQDITIGLWLNPGLSGNFEKYLQFSEGNNTGSIGDNRILLTRRGNSNEMRVNFAVGGTTYPTDEAVGTLAANQWQFYMFTIGNNGVDTEINLYKDGNQTPTASRTIAGALPSTVTRTGNFIGGGWSGNATLDGGIADLVIFDKALSSQEVEDYYNDVALVGAENKFFTMDEDKMDDALDKLEAHFDHMSVTIEAHSNLLAFKKDLHQSEITSLMTVDTEQTATEVNLAGIRQNLAMTSLSIASSSQANILNLF